MELELLEELIVEFVMLDDVVLEKEDEDVLDLEELLVAVFVPRSLLCLFLA